ncbi:MAG: hypothetical protein C5B58_14915, partial [Acidobacteria bacterium]
MRSKIRKTKQEFAAPLSLGLIAAFVLLLCVPALREKASAADVGGVDLRAIQEEINTIKKHESADRHRVDQDERTIQTLEQQLRQLELRNATLTDRA